MELISSSINYTDTFTRSSNTATGCINNVTTGLYTIRVYDQDSTIIVTVLEQVFVEQSLSITTNDDEILRTNNNIQSSINAITLIPTTSTTSNTINTNTLIPTTSNTTSTTINTSNTITLIPTISYITNTITSNSNIISGSVIAPTEYSTG